MKILLICSGKIENGRFSGGSWIEALIDDLGQRADIELHVAYPTYGGVESKIIIGNVNFFAFPHIKSIYKVDRSAVCFLEWMIKYTEPDVIHVSGTEYPYCLESVTAANNVGKLSKVLVMIQGLCSRIAEHYCETIPNKVQRNFTVRDFLRMDNILQQKRKMEKRGKNEIGALSLVKNVGGRTEWDYTCTEIINSTRRYFHIGERLRREFYTDQWYIDKCEEHSIFVSQCSYTIKGFHLVIEAVGILKEKYPDIKVYTTGQSVMNGSYNIRENSYAQFLRKRITELDLEDRIFFCGQLSAGGMKERYLKANVFVSSSLIENSSNSIGEAMLIGCPIVSSLVGGVSDFITDGVEGLLYQSTASYMLAHKIEQIFDDRELAGRLSLNARNKAQFVFNQDRNMKELFAAYDFIKDNY